MGNIFARRNLSELNLFGTGNVFTQDQLDEYQAREQVFNHFVLIIIPISGLHLFHQERHSKVIIICLISTSIDRLKLRYEYVQFQTLQTLLWIKSDKSAYQYAR